MAKPTKQKVRKGKKKWFKVVAPDYMNKAELGEIAAFEPSNLPGRTVCIPLKEITGSMRDSSNKVKLQIVKVQGETCQTEAVEIFIQASQIQRTERRAKTRIISIVDAVTKDKQKVRIKAYILLQNKVVRSIRTELQNVSENFLSSFIKHRDAKDVFTTTSQKTISNNLKTQLKKIYPASVMVWRIKRLS